MVLRLRMKKVISYVQFLLIVLKVNNKYLSFSIYIIYKYLLSINKLIIIIDSCVLILISFKLNIKKQNRCQIKFYFIFYYVIIYYK